MHFTDGGIGKYMVLVSIYEICAGANIKGECNIAHLDSSPMYMVLVSIHGSRHRRNTEGEYNIAP